MITLPSGVRVWLACGHTDMRKGMDGLAMLAQQVLEEDPFSGALFAFRGKRGGLIKILWFDGQGMCLFSKRLEKGHFLWPTTNTGRVSLTPAQVSMLLEVSTGACRRASGARNWRADAAAHAGFNWCGTERGFTVPWCPWPHPLPRIRRRCSTAARSPGREVGVADATLTMVRWRDTYRRPDRQNGRPRRGTAVLVL